MNPRLQEILHNITTRLAALEQSQKKEWQGLTENEKELLWDESVEGREHFCSQYGDFADAIEAKLKEKNS